MSSSHPWKFFRRSGLVQVALTSGADLLALDQLDQKLWVALSCPVRGLELDEKTLALIDTDKDGRIRAPELIAAVAWAAARLKDPGALLQGAEVLPYSALNSDSPEGRAVAVAARQVLANLGKTESDGLSVEELSEPEKIFSRGRLRGDGVITPESAPDEATAQLIRDIASSASGSPPGVTRRQVDDFESDLRAYAQWRAEGTAAAIAVLGEGTGAAYQAISAVRAKVKDYFDRCRLAEYDPRSLAALSEPEGELAALPLARIEAGKPLPLGAGANPAWAEALAALQRDAVAPGFGPAQDALTAEEWSALLRRFSAYEAWLRRKAGGRVEALDGDRALALLREPALGRLAALLDEDEALAPSFAAVGDLERLVRYHRDLRALLHNFVNFADFYSRQKRAIFQAGTLYLDSRSCDLCLKADNPAAHAGLATMGRLYLAYLECRRPGNATLSIAAGVTQGDSNYLFVGRNGIFYDRQGRDWDATVVKLIENPISIHQAFFTPYKRVAAFVQDQIGKLAAAKDQAATASLSQGVVAAGSSADPGKAASQPFDIAKFAGIFAAIGLAIGAVGGAVASVAVGFMHLAPWQMPLAVIGALLIVSGPSMLIAAIKLHQRNLGPILEASGWAINGRVKINLPLGRVLTQRAAPPRGALRGLRDPYEDRSARRRRWIIISVVVALAAAAVAAKVYGFWPW